MARRSSQGQDPIPPLVFVQLVQHLEVAGREALQEVAVDGVRIYRRKVSQSGMVRTGAMRDGLKAEIKIRSDENMSVSFVHGEIHARIHNLGGTVQRKRRGGGTSTVTYRAQNFLHRDTPEARQLVQQAEQDLLHALESKLAQLLR